MNSLCAMTRDVLWVGVFLTLSVWGWPQFAAAQDAWKKAQTDVENRRKEVMRILAERRDGTEREVSRKTQEMVSDLQKVIDQYLSKQRMTKEIDFCKKYIDLLKSFDGAQGRAYQDLVLGMKQWKEALARFAAEQGKQEAEVLAAAEKIMKITQDALAPMGSGKTSVADFLAQAMLDEEKTVPKLAETLADLKKQADALVGRESTPAKNFEKWLDTLRNTRSGLKEVEEMGKAAKESADKWERDRQEALKAFGDKFANLLAGPEQHKPFQETLKKWQRAVESGRDIAASEKGFMLEQTQKFNPLLTKMSKAVADTGAFEKGDYELLVKHLDMIARVCGRYKIDAPKWHDELVALSRQLVGMADDLSEMQERWDRTKEHADTTFQLAQRLHDQLSTTIRAAKTLDDVIEYRAAVAKARADFDRVWMRLDYLVSDFKTRRMGVKKITNAGGIYGLRLTLAIQRRLGQADQYIRALEQRMDKDDAVRAVRGGLE